MTEGDEKRLAARLRAHADNGTCPSSSEMREAADALDTERAERARVERELQRISFASGNVGIEHPEWPPEYARHVAALIARATQAESALAAAREAMQRAQTALDQAKAALTFHLISDNCSACSGAVAYVNNALRDIAALTPETP